MTLIANLRDSHTRAEKKR